MEQTIIRMKTTRTILYRTITRIPILVLLIICAQAGMAQEYKAVANKAAVQAKINKVAAETSTIKSNFTQEKHLSFMTEPIVSQGLFFFQKENKLRWEYLKPFEYLILFNGNTITIKDERKTNQFDAGSNAMFKQINDLMLGAVKGDLAQSPDFTLLLLESAKAYQVKLTPTNAELKKYIAAVEIYFSKSDLTVSSLRMIEATGDFTKITFTHKVFNSTFDEAVFAVH